MYVKMYVGNFWDLSHEITNPTFTKMLYQPHSNAPSHGAGLLTLVKSCWRQLLVLAARRTVQPS